jgi:uncharacterized membrane protein YgdD (TMEM256/DUF423 family)
VTSAPVAPDPGVGARLLRALPPLLCAFGVGLGAYASHAGGDVDAHRLGLAALFAFGHGVALVALEGGGRVSRLSTLGRIALLAGVLLFSGSLAGAALAGTPVTLAPAGGTLMILGWVLLACERALARRH